MKNNSSQNVYVELIFTVIVAFALTIAFSAVVVFVVSQFGAMTRGVTNWINALSSALAGLIVGYRLNTLLVAVSKSKTKKKK